MPVSSGSVLLTAAVHLNDPSQLVYTPTILLPFLNMAINELEEEMAVFELTPLIQDSSPINISAGATQLSGLPVDFVEMINLVERPQGSSERWVEVKETKDLDNNLVVQPVTDIVEWAIRNLNVFINPPTSPREVIVNYLRGLTQATTGNNIDLTESRRFLALLTARNAARDAGNAPNKAATYKEDIDRCRDRVIRRMQKGAQSPGGVRRLPYRGRG